MHVKILVWCKGWSSCFWSHVLIPPRQKAGRQWDSKGENVCKSSSGGNVTFSFSTWCIPFVTNSWQDPHVWNLCVEYQKLGNQMSIFLMKSMKPVPSLVTRQDCRCAAIFCQTLLKHVLILCQHVKDSMHQGIHSGVGNSYGLVHIKQREDLENYAFLLYYALWNWQGCWVLVGLSQSRNFSLNRKTPSHQLWILNNCRSTNCSRRCVFDLKEPNICEVCCGEHLKQGDMRWVEISFAICTSRDIACFQW